MPPHTTNPTRFHDRRRATRSRSGSALIVAVWVIALLSLMIGSFAFEMKLESRIAGYYRQRLKAEQIARSGIEKARFLLYQSSSIDPKNPSDAHAEKDWYDQARRLQEGLNVVRITDALGVGELNLTIVPEPSLINVNELKTLEDWEGVFDRAGIPEDQWPILLDAFLDWIDPDDVPHPDGAESDDYYLTLEKPYRAKNAPLDTVDELLLIKGFTNTYYYGGVLESDGPGRDDETNTPPIRGLAGFLTTYGSRQVNINAASLDVLQAISLDIDDSLAREIILEREGDPEFPEENTSYKNADDFFNRFSDYPDLRNRLKDRITTQSQILRIVSIGRVGDVTWTVSCIVEQVKGQLRILRWQEETAL
jgi:type II secretory pathway component PulK